MHLFKPALACDRIANYRVGYYYPIQRRGTSFGPRAPFLFIFITLITYLLIMLPLRVCL